MLLSLDREEVRLHEGAWCLVLGAALPLIVGFGCCCYGLRWEWHLQFMSGLLWTSVSVEVQVVRG